MQSHALVERLDNGAWQLATPTTPGDQSEFRAVAVVAANDVWAAGTYRLGNNPHALLMRWNGIGWQQYTVDSLGTNNSYLYGVFARAADDVWAVGGYASGGGTAPLVLHWDGQAWNWIVIAAPAGTSNNVLLGVAAVGSDDMWTVGQSSGSSTVRPLLLRCSPSTCSRATELDGAQNATLRSVAAAGPQDLWAVGDQDRGAGSYGTYSAHWTGAAWSAVNNSDPPPTVLPANRNFLRGVAAAQADDVWAVGMYIRDGTPWLYRTLTERKVIGTPGPYFRWLDSPNRLVNGQAVDNELNGVAAAGSSNFWAVGYFTDANLQLFQSLILHYTDGTTPTPTATPTRTATRTPTADQPPHYTTSYYVQSISTLKANKIGCEARARGEKGIVALDFGAPVLIDSDLPVVYGTKLIHLDVKPNTDQIKDVVRAYEEGYVHPHICPIGPFLSSPDLIIAIGVSNSALPLEGVLRDNPDLTFAHGQAWAKMVSDLSKEFDDSKLSPAVQVAGAYDAEYYGSPLGDCRRSDGRRGRCPDFRELASVSADEWTVNLKQGTTDKGTAPWAEGYNTSQPDIQRIAYYNFGSCEDCPRVSNPATWELNPDLREVLPRVYHLSWELFTAFPLPQIYHEPLPYEWYNVRWYAYSTYNVQMSVQGATSGCVAAPSSVPCTPVPNAVRLQPSFNEACHPQTPCIPEWTYYNCNVPCPFLPPSVAWQALSDMLKSPDTPEGTPNPALPIQQNGPFWVTDIIYQ